MGRDMPCRYKERFATGSKARRALRAIKARGIHGDRGKPQRAYSCPFCRGWHLTSWDTDDGR